MRTVTQEVYVTSQSVGDSPVGGEPVGTSLVEGASIVGQGTVTDLQQLTAHRLGVTPANRTMNINSVLVTGIPAIRNRTRVHFPQTPCIQHVVSQTGELIRVLAVQNCSGVPCILEVPASIGYINNVWDQFPEFSPYDFHPDATNLPFSACRSGERAEISTVAFFNPSDPALNR